MLKDNPDKAKKAEEIAQKLADHKQYLSHGRTLGITRCIELGLNIKDLRKMPELRQELWKLYCLIEILFDRTPMVKLFENSRGTGWARNFIEQVIQIPISPPPTPQIPQSPLPKGT
jgi:hypothetical protein